MEQLRRETTQHARALELRTKNWDLAARLRAQGIIACDFFVGAVGERLTIADHLSAVWLGAAADTSAGGWRKITPKR